VGAKQRFGFMLQLVIAGADSMQNGISPPYRVLESLRKYGYYPIGVLAHIQVTSINERNQSRAKSEFHFEGKRHGNLRQEARQWSQQFGSP
jgi:hypothetical protein